VDECINPAYRQPARIKRLHAIFRAAKPFPHLVLQRFFLPGLAEELRQALLAEEFVPKESDLFRFRQTATDLKVRPAFEQFADFINSHPFLQVIRGLTGITALRRADMTGFIYGSGDRLLPHDDRLAGRRIAYVLNLSRGFTRRDGGGLTFFMTKDGRPVRPAGTIPPAFNTLTLFEVSRKSFHQVDEVLADRERLSIAGWFHGA
jgi:Rps23 Pro-64 3,4-dihydroxylase Tpa1-like proline 4-hydroxylase